MRRTLTSIARLSSPPIDTPALLPDFVSPGLDVIFVGGAPSLNAAASGHYYAGTRNRFWSFLQQSGLTPRQLQEEEDSKVLKLGIGLTALFPSIASSENARLPIPNDSEREILLPRLKRAAPKVVCYNGKDVYLMVTGLKTAPWGLQRCALGSSHQFIVPSTSGRADA